MLLHAMDGAIWGSLAWLSLPTSTNAGSVLILAVLAGIAANSMSILSPVLPVFVVFVVCELGSSFMRSFHSTILPIGRSALPSHCMS
jgi:hypothetical protein